jgi:hypothetical protein
MRGSLTNDQRTRCIESTLAKAGFSRHQHQKAMNPQGFIKWREVRKAVLTNRAMKDEKVAKPILSQRYH